jgi:hypothetical protein
MTIDKSRIEIEKRKFLNIESLHEDLCFDYVSDLQKKWLGDYDDEKLISIFFYDNNLQNVSDEVSEKIFKNEAYEKFENEFISISNNFLKFISPSLECNQEKKEIQKKLALHTFHEFQNLNFEKISNYHDFGPGSGRTLIALICFFKLGYIKNFNYIAHEGSTVHIIYMNLMINFFSAVYSNDSIKFGSYTALHNRDIKRKNSDINLFLNSLWSKNKFENEEAAVIFVNDFFDQISKFDFENSLKVIKNILNDNTIIYLKGGIEKSNLKNLYLFGYGTYHGENIEINIKKHLNVNCISSSLELDKVVRIYSKIKNPSVLNTISISHQESDKFENDEEILKCFNQLLLQKSINAQDKLVIWSDEDLNIYNNFVKEIINENNILAFTSEKINFDHKKNNYNFKTLENANLKNCKKMIICSATPKLAIRLFEEKNNNLNIRSIGSVITIVESD